MALLRHTCAALALGALIAAPAFAEGRFELQEIDGGFIRLDRETGQVSHCTRESTGLACRGAADDVTALTEELAAAEARIAELEAEVARLQKLAGEAGERTMTEDLPSEEEMEEFAGWFERMAAIFARVLGNVTEEIEGQGQEGSGEPSEAPAEGKT